MNSSSRSSGFTLIEVLIVSVLLFFLSMTLFQTIRMTVSAKEDIDQKTEVTQGARAAFSLIERDLKAVFYVTAEDLGWSIVRPPNLPADQTWVPPPKPLPVTIFQGQAGEVFMTSRTHQRLSVDSPENDQHFVTYQLHDKDLIRAESLRAVSLSDREDPARFHQFTILENVKSFKLSYYDIKTEKWLDSWDTEKAEMKDRLPDAIKFEIEYQPEDKSGNKRHTVGPMSIATIVRPTESIFKKLPVPLPGAPGQAPGGRPGGQDAKADGGSP